MVITPTASSVRLRLHTLAVVIAVSVATAVASPALARSCWLPPVDAPVVDPFREPKCRWCPGNRGLEYATEPGTTIVAVATGRVTFTGSVAGTRYVVVRHADGLRVTYGNLTSTRHRRGDLVVVGVTIGVAAGAFHLGVRDGERYVDPARFIGELRHRVRLVPADGRPGRRGPPPRLVCAS